VSFDNFLWKVLFTITWQCSILNLHTCQEILASRLESDKRKTSPGILVVPGAFPREPVDGGDKIV
jgi:hypothetical protein